MKKRSSTHRYLYKKWHGFIPTDELGRTYDIHHKDGNHENNSVENLIAIPIQEHYDIHYRNQDYSACALIACRMKMSTNEISRLTSLAAQKRVADGTHHWLTTEHSNNVKESIKRRVNDGTYHMLGGEIQKDFQLKRVQARLVKWRRVRLLVICLDWPRLLAHQCLLDQRASVLRHLRHCKSVCFQLIQLNKEQS
jgi:hypothetical protein